MSGHAVGMDRATRVAGALAARDLDVLLVTDLTNVRWLTGFTGSNAVAVVGPGETRRFLTDFRYLTQSTDQVDPGWAREIHQDLLARAAEGLGGTLRVGIDDAHMSVRDGRRLRELLPDGEGDEDRLRPAGGLVEDLRAVKDPEEIERMRAAARLADAALEEVLSRGLAGRTEREVGLDLEMTMRRAGAEAAAFPPIIASGAHGALPHAEPRDVAIPEGVLVTIDWGAQLDGYMSDCTRTFATGELDPRDRGLYELVFAAQEAALAAVTAGPTGREVDAVARDIIEAAGHGEHFGHGLGHGVGLAVHEGPRLSKLGETRLEPGMVVTVEPGVYVPGATGVRIEDLAVVTDGAPDVLTSIPKALRVVG